jgi:hypothetical protein
MSWIPAAYAPGGVSFAGNSVSFRARGPVNSGVNHRLLTDRCAPECVPILCALPCVPSCVPCPVGLQSTANLEAANLNANLDQCQQVRTPIRTKLVRTYIRTFTPYRFRWGRWGHWGRYSVAPVIAGIQDSGRWPQSGLCAGATGATTFR